MSDDESSSGSSLSSHTMPSRPTPDRALSDGLPGLSNPPMASPAEKAGRSSSTLAASPTIPRTSTTTSSTSPKSPAMRFRRAVRKVIAMRRAASYMVPGVVGAEPGVDPRRASANRHYAHIRQQCVVEIVDYSVARASVGRMTNRELVGLLQDSRASAREPWARVRWINVGGISWDVISALTLRYDIHPLVVEDILHQHGGVRSKADYYPTHIFLRVLCHKLSSDADAHGALVVPEHPESVPMEEKLETAEGRRASGFVSRGWGTLRRRAHDVEDAEWRSAPPPPPIARSSAQYMVSERKKKNAQERQLVHALKKEDRVNVKVQPMYILLFRDGTVISFTQDPDIDFLEPIVQRLCQPDTGLRQTADPSLLVESLIDLIVDQALEVVDEYQGKLLKIEQAVLIRPSMKTVRGLHVLQEDLIQMQRTLEPVKTLVHGLRKYDEERALAAAPLATAGFMSHKAKIYLADVYDHMEYVLMSLDMFANVSDNLINYTFNMVSYQMNNVMKRLTLITIIFLPLTFLSGYFGMNFVNMWSTHATDISDLLYWEIALPVMAIVVPMFLIPDLRRWLHRAKKVFELRRMQARMAPVRRTGIGRWMR